MLAMVIMPARAVCARGPSSGFGVGWVKHSNPSRTMGAGDGESPGRFADASGIDQVWRAAHGNRCQTLLVEMDFEYPADLAPTGDRLLPYTGHGAAALDDAVDEVIENVIAKGGEVFFYEPGVLDPHQRIAAVLRY